ncbi:hypothetical protein, partial [Paenibacillus dakarensis]|uniref:hypothetical protein n=1 Tax=Paenibacillus dakarensis TaxID=1527293 RepID=UPI001BA5E294
QFSKVNYLLFRRCRIVSGDFYNISHCVSFSQEVFLIFFRLNFLDFLLPERPIKRAKINIPHIVSERQLLY